MDGCQRFWTFSWCFSPIFFVHPSPYRERSKVIVMKYTNLVCTRTSLTCWEICLVALWPDLKLLAELCAKAANGAKTASLAPPSWHELTHKLTPLYLVCLIYEKTKTVGDFTGVISRTIMYRVSTSGHFYTLVEFVALGRARPVVFPLFPAFVLKWLRALASYWAEKHEGYQSHLTPCKIAHQAYVPRCRTVALKPGFCLLSQI